MVRGGKGWGVEWRGEKSGRGGEKKGEMERVGVGGERGRRK